MHTPAGTAAPALVRALGRARRRVRAWWEARTVRFRKVTRTVGLLLAVAVVSLTVGMTTAQASSPVGPHEATWEATVNSEITLDLGPLGMVSMDSPAAPLGVDVVLGEIPSQLGVTTPQLAQDDGKETAAVSTALTSDVSDYVALASHPGLTIERGVRALVGDGLRRAGLIASVLLMLVAAGRLASEGHLRDTVSRAARRPLAVTLVVTCTLAGTLAVLVPAVRSEHTTGTTLEALAGTPLASARFSGRVADVVQAYGGVVTSFLDESSTFYAQAGLNLAAAWDASQEVGGSQDVTGVAGGAAVVVPTGQMARDLVARSSGLPDSTQDGTTAVLTTDLHCNLDVIAFAGQLDSLAGADLHMDDGDLTMTGSEPEQVCVDALDRAVPSETAKVATTGNHDSPSTAARLRSLGWTVTDGTTRTVAGLRILGDADPQRTTATGTVQVGEETVTDLGARLAGVSCTAGQEPDLVLVHQPGTFGQLAGNGCAPLLVAGHVHAEKGVTVVTGSHGDVAELVAGAAKGGTSLGAVTQDAYLHVLRFGDDGSLTAWRVVVLHPDASVTVGRWKDLPASSGPATTPDSQDGETAGTAAPTDSPTGGSVTQVPVTEGATTPADS